MKQILSKYPLSVMNGAIFSSIAFALMLHGLFFRGWWGGAGLVLLITLAIFETVFLGVHDCELGPKDFDFPRLRDDPGIDSHNAA